MNVEIGNYNISPRQENGIELSDKLFITMREKNTSSLRTAIDALQDAVDEKKMCSRLRDGDLLELLKKGEIILYVGTGSAGNRIYIKPDRLYMLVSEHDLKYGYGKRCQDNFRRLFNIPEGKELLFVYQEKK